MSNDPAQTRFFTLAIVRLIGGLMVLAGILVVAGKLPIAGWAGYVLILLGMFEFFFLPTLLARQWSSRDE